MSREALYPQLVIKQKNAESSLPVKIVGSLFLLLIGFMLGILLVSHFSIGEPLLKRDYTPIKRLPKMMDRAVLDTSAYVYVKHASIRSELNIPWDEWIKKQRKEKTSQK